MSDSGRIGSIIRRMIIKRFFASRIQINEEGKPIEKPLQGRGERDTLAKITECTVLYSVKWCLPPMTSKKTPLELCSYLLATMVVLGFGVYVVAFFLHSFAVILHPWSVDYVEVPELNRALRMAKGESIYTKWESPPFLESNYTPLFTWIHSWFVDAQKPLFWPGRLINVFLTICSAGLISRIVYVVSNSRLGSVLASLLYLSSHIVWMWASLLRVDTFAVFCNVLALWMYLETKNKSRNWVYLMAFVCICAAFSRQTMIASSISIFLALLLHERPRAFRFLGTYVLLGLVGIAGLMWSTDGLAYTHLVLANINDFSWANVWFFLGSSWDVYHVLFIVSTGGMVLVWRQEWGLFFYVLCSFGVALTVGKVGASLNYLLELWVGITILCSVVVGWIARCEYPHKNLLSCGFWMLLLVSWQQQLHVPWSRMPKPQGGITAQADESWDKLARMIAHLPLAYLDPFGERGDALLARSIRHYSAHPGMWDEEAQQNIEENLRNFPGIILSEDMNFTVLSGRALWIQPFEFSQLAQKDMWNEHVLHTEIAKQGFALLVLLFDLQQDVSHTPSGERFSLATRKIMCEQYELLAKEGPYWIYSPKSNER